MQDIIEPVMQDPKETAAQIFARKLPDHDGAIAVYIVMFLVAIITVPMVQKNQYSLANIALYLLAIIFFVVAGTAIIRMVSGEPSKKKNNQENSGSSPSS
jgi:hypothetical protein